MNRRRFLQSAAAVAAAAHVPLARAASASAVVKPKRLAPGDTVALVSPANATFNTVELDIARESLEALGFKVRQSEHMMERYGYFAGQDKARADDINKAFADRSVACVHAIRGGWGSARLLPYLDFDAIRRNPKVIIGYSDITALLLAVHAKTGIITFHGPIGLGRWDPYSLDYYKRVLFNGEPVTYSNKQGISSDRNALTQVEFRTRTITPGKARGRLLGGNLTVLTTILGSPYLPDWDNAILFCEDVREDLYRVDRMAVSRSSASSLYFLLRAISSGEAPNSSIDEPEAPLIAWLLPSSRKFLVPYLAWISCSFGRLSPMVLTWKSPVSISTSTAFTTGGVKSRFLYFASHGAFSSK